MKKWVVATKRADFNSIASRFAISPMLARIMRNRDIIDEVDINLYLNGTIKDMHAPSQLKDIDKAVDILREAVEANSKIMIIGDYDIDGVCASYILKKGLDYAGADTVVRLPDRVKDGYGLSSSMIDEAISLGISVIITCDNGIAASNEIRYAKDNGIIVVVTDHHEIPYVEKDGERKYILPMADAVVDPKQEDCSYPYKEICGAMVAYKLIQLILSSDLASDDLMKNLLMFAGFATVGDVMELKNENRIAVKHALKHMQVTDNPGMNALIDVTKLDRMHIAPYHIGFVLGPCINATGRLDSAMRALELFMAENYEEAVKIALELKELNDSRKDMTVYYTEKAIEMLETDEDYRTARVLVVYLPECHESLAGIIAGRIKEKYYKPTFVLTDSEGVVKGSGRSIEGYNMYEEMIRVSDCFIKFGGHMMAAGCSLEAKNIDKFRNRLNENCTMAAEDMIEKLVIDIAMPIDYATMNFAKEIGKLEPYGNGNSKPLFAQKNLTVKNIKVMGKNRNAVKLLLQSDSDIHTCVEAVCFGNADEIVNEISSKSTLAVAYEIGINEYMGQQNVQLILKDWY